MASNDDSTTKTLANAENRSSVDSENSDVCNPSPPTNGLITTRSQSQTLVGSCNHNTENAAAIAAEVSTGRLTHLIPTTPTMRASQGLRERVAMSPAMPATEDKRPR